MYFVEKHECADIKMYVVMCSVDTKYTGIQKKY